MNIYSQWLKEIRVMDHQRLGDFLCSNFFFIYRRKNLGDVASFFMYDLGSNLLN